MENKYIYGAVALLVILVILFLIIRKRGSDSSTPTDDKRDTVGPTIEVGNLQATQNPDKSDNTVEKTSSYIIRASEGYAEEGEFDDKELSKNIQLGLTWNNGGGFDDVKVIKVKWEQQVPDPDDDTKTKNEVRMTETINKNTDTIKYFTQYSSGLSHTFTANMQKPGGDGEALPVPDDKKFSAVGINMIHVYYIDKDGNEVRLTGDDVQTYVVTVDDLSATKDLLSAKTYIYKPTTGSVTISATITDNEYYMYSVGISQDIIRHIDPTKSGKIVILPEGENADNDIVRLRVKLDNDVGKYFLKMATGGIISIQPTNDATVFDDTYKFSTVAGKDNDHIRFRQTGEDNNNKFMMVDFGDDKKLKIKNYTTIDDLCTNNSLDFMLSKTVKAMGICGGRNVSGLDFKSGDTFGDTVFKYDENQNSTTKMYFEYVNGDESALLYIELENGKPKKYTINPESKSAYRVYIVPKGTQGVNIDVQNIVDPTKITGEPQIASDVSYRTNFYIEMSDPITTEQKAKKYHLYKKQAASGAAGSELDVYTNLGVFQLR